jgi:competence protein ComEC
MKSLSARLQKIIFEYGKIICAVFFSIGLIFSFLFLYREAVEKKLRVTFFDVGQGDAILIQTPSGHDVLIDGGPTFDVTKKLSKKMGYFDKHLDVVIATHDDADHITGLIPVLKRYVVSSIIISSVDGTSDIDQEFDKAIEKEGKEVHKGVRGEYIDFGDGVTLHILHPFKRESEGDTNEASVVTLLVYDEVSFLLTGDLGKEREVFLIDEVIPKFVSVYKAGHHGSKTSSGEVLLSRIHPEYTVLSVGKSNRYGHPHVETMERLKKYSKEILSTAERGDIEFISDGVRIEIKTEKDE